MLSGLVISCGTTPSTQHLLARYVCLSRSASPADRELAKDIKRDWEDALRAIAAGREYDFRTAEGAALTSQGEAAVEEFAKRWSGQCK